MEQNRQTLADRLKEKTLKCSVCGHEWLKRAKEPVRCANPACRSKRWSR